MKNQRIRDRTFSLALIAAVSDLFFGFPLALSPFAIQCTAKGRQMPQKQGKSAVKRAGGAVARTARKLATKLDPRKRAKVAAAPKAKKAKAAKPKAVQTKTAKTKTAKTNVAPTKASPTPPRIVRRESDVPMDAIAQEYAPHQTSIKTSFRSDGSDHERDQELPPGAGERFENEDHFTNKSGDARIGTHGRTYEPGEKRAAAANHARR
jgi:hypothetical protein